MKLAIIGYGKLGKAVGSAWEEDGGIVTDTITSSSKWKASELDCDVVLESSTPDSATRNILACINCGLPVVVGSTGWYKDLAKVEEAIQQTHGQLFHATNFSIGVHLLNVFSTQMASTLRSFKNYKPAIVESHHIHKLDKPSGTALTLSEKISDVSGISKIKIDSIREEEIIGIHELVWNSEMDSISIKHEAKNRKGFALGAVQAAKWIVEQKSKGRTSVFTMDDMIKEL
ncbi:MAG: 4-hydroxy-tetrahydrodipicolinate reductase [Crocinitomicaceae bacterium]|nr:4-hydroxy-tetrahydrodipicolinate reductase [Crocinitomicaceae bacterium]|tara:strand:+ start:4955 stop:5644 length:690 start_codon:yes stop_codon:yes gene_type:complete